MKHSLVLKISAIVYIIFGVPLLLAPNALMAVYGVDPMNHVGVYNTMLFGATFIGLGVMTWVASQQEYREVRAVILGVLVANALGFAVALYRQLTQTEVPPSAWVNVALFLVFSVLYAKLYFGSTADRPSTQPA
jgi:hypothetical protein